MQKRKIFLEVLPLVASLAAVPAIAASCQNTQPEIKNLKDEYIKVYKQARDLYRQLENKNKESARQTLFAAITETNVIVLKEDATNEDITKAKTDLLKAIEVAQNSPEDPKTEPKPIPNPEPTPNSNFDSVAAEVTITYPNADKTPINKVKLYDLVLNPPQSFEVINNSYKIDKTNNSVLAEFQLKDTKSTEISTKTYTKKINFAKPVSILEPEPFPIPTPEPEPEPTPNPTPESEDQNEFDKAAARVYFFYPDAETKQLNETTLEEVWPVWPSGYELINLTIRKLHLANKLAVDFQLKNTTTNKLSAKVYTMKITGFLEPSSTEPTFDEDSSKVKAIYPDIENITLEDFDFTKLNLDVPAEYKYEITAYYKEYSQNLLVITYNLIDKEQGISSYTNTGRSFQIYLKDFNPGFKKIINQLDWNFDFAQSMLIVEARPEYIDITNKYQLFINFEVTNVEPLYEQNKVRITYNLTRFEQTLKNLTIDIDYFKTLDTYVDEIKSSLNYTDKDTVTAAEAAGSNFSKLTLDNLKNGVEITDATAKINEENNTSLDVTFKLKFTENDTVKSKKVKQTIEGFKA